MKRNTTELEEKLLLNGWKMIYKTYKGNKSQFVWSYVYVKTYPDYIAKLVLDQKRTKTLGVYIENKCPEFIGALDLQDLTQKYDELNKTIHFIEFGFPFDGEETIEVVESVENE